MVAGNDVCLFLDVEFELPGNIIAQARQGTVFDTIVSSSAKGLALSRRTHLLIHVSQDLRPDERLYANRDADIDPNTPELKE